ncbi:acyltransferase family protein [Aliikangiella sp. IMCC44653]
MTRYHFMDSMRAVLMMLGIALHSAQIYNPDKSWLFFSNQTSDVAYYLVHSIMTFRMPAFFVVSGFFCYLTITRYELNFFASQRLKRIAIPLVVTIISLNSLQAYLLTKSHFYTFNLADYIINGEYLSHLWFLINLIVYFCLAIVAMAYLRQSISKIGRYIANFINAVPMLVTILLLPLITVAFFTAGKLGFPIYKNYIGIIDIYNLIIFTPYFIFGAILGANVNLLNRFVSVNPLLLLGLLCGALWSFKNFNWPIKILNSITEIYLENLIVWVAVALCFYFFHKLTNKPTKQALFLSDASYTVYLFHHIFVVGIGLIVVQQKLSPVLSMLILMSSTLAATLLIHKYIIVRSNLLRYLFNGK